MPTIILTPDSTRIKIEIPEEYIGKTIDITIKPVEEIKETPIGIKTKKKK